jgi:3-hydroxymyristoyl/3-hydroxydecanoyl-(acyl carrier protein) dehydratase
MGEPSGAMTTELRLSLTVPTGHPCLDGHFPDAPIVPGVVLLDMIMSQLNDTHGIRIACVEQSKFLSPLLPGEVAEAIYTLTGKHIAFRVECKRQDQITCLAVGKFIVKGRSSVIRP